MKKYFMHFMSFLFVITFKPNKTQTHLTPQNDCLNLSFVKYIHVCRWQKNDPKLSQNDHLLFTNFGNHHLVLRKQIVGQTNTYSCPNEIRTDFSDIVYTALLYIPEASEGLKIRGAISISPH